MQGALSTSERWLRGVLIGHAILSALLAAGYIVAGDTGTLVSLPNSFAKDVLFVALSVIAAADVRRFGGARARDRRRLRRAHLGEIAALIWGGAPDPDLPLVGEISATAALLGWMGIDVVLAALFTWLWLRAARDGHRLRYLHPLAFLTLAAVAEVLIEGERETIAPREVARNVDEYLADLESTGKGRVQAGLIVLGLWPLLTARPPLSVLDPETRRKFLRKRFDEISGRRVFRPLLPIVRALIRTGAQMSYLGYYGDRRSWGSIGYTTYPSRPDGRLPLPEDAIEPPLKPLTEPPRRRYDTVVIGSGAAGGILAYRFAETGRKVLVLERGPHVDPRRFDDDEVRQYLKLYNEGALQLATDFGLQVLQGMCVGGGTTINNALCLRPPELVLEQWEPRGLDRAALKAAIEDVRTWFGVEPIRDTTTTKAAKRFGDAVGRLDLPGAFEVMEANISSACRATGYCNIGCGYGAKLSTLDTVLPRAHHRFGLDLMADVRVEKIEREGTRAVRVVGRHGPSSSRVEVEADEIVIAAGAIGSSYLLQRSGLGGEAVGRDLHFNINSPLTADFPDEVDSFDGIQMSHAYRSSDGVPRFLVETWFNPPATQALAMPGWFGDHFRNMQRYRHLASLRRAGGNHVAGPREAREERAGDRVHGVCRRSRRDRRGPAGRGPDLVRGRRRAGHARHLRLAGVPHAGVAVRAPAQRARVRRPADDERAPAGRERARRGRRRGLPGARARQPLPLRRQRVPHQRAREPAAHRDGHGPVRRAPDRRPAAGVGAGRRRSRHHRLMDFVIVGAGTFGASLAWWLARAGERVTLVDQFEPGDRRATSGGETRLIRCSHGADPDYTAMARRARTLWRELEAESGEELMVECGVAWFARSDDGWDAESARTLAAQGIPVERLEPGEAARLYPSFRGDDLAFVLLEPEAGVVRAQRAVRALARQAQAHGARLLRGRARPDGAAAVLEDGTRLEGDAVVWACGGWLAALFGDLVGIKVTRQELLFLDGGPAWRGVPAWVDYERAMYGTGDLDALGVKAALDVDGPALDPDAELLDTPTTEPQVRAYLRERFPALEHARAGRGARLPLRAVARLELHRGQDSRGRVAARRRLRPRLQARPGDGRADGRRAGRERRAARSLRPRPARARAKSAHGGVGCENLSAG